jgi:hypothetical protein
MDIELIVCITAELLCKFIQYWAWPIVVLIGVIVLARRLPEVLGAIQYRHLVLISSIKEYSYWVTDLVRRNTNKDDKLDPAGIEVVYNVLSGNTNKSDKMRYDLNNFVKLYKTYCPRLVEVKLFKFNKKARTLEEKQDAVYQYYTDWTALINTAATDEYLKGREDLKTIANNIISISNLIKADKA